MNKNRIRTFATMRTIESITPIKNKDKIVCTKLKDLGFNIVTTSEYKVGDQLIYFEAGSLIKAGNPKFEFLRDKCYVEEQNGFRVKSLKMFGIYSDGLTIPYNELKEDLGNIEFEEGKDISEILNVVKYIDDDIEAPGTNFPGHLVVQTDEIRYQNIINTLKNDIKDIEFVGTLKYDGSSMTYIIHDDMFYVCSRSQTVDKLPLKDAIEKYTKEDISKSNDPFIKFTYQTEMPKLLNSLYDGRTIVFQGELCGAKIQNNRLMLNDNKYFVFNIKINNEYQDYETMKDILNQLNCEDISPVKIVVNSCKFADGNIMTPDSTMTLESFSKKLDSIKYNGTDNSIEGLVFRAKNKNEMVSKIADFKHPLNSFKILNPNY